MKNKLIIIGAGGHSRPVLSILLKNKDFKSISIVDKNFSGRKDHTLGIPVIGDIEEIKKFNPTETSLFIALGDNSTRKKIYEKYTLQKFSFINVIHSTAIIDESASIGYGNFIGPFAHIGPEAILGDSNIINSYANIEHETILGNYCHAAPGSVICGRCKLGNNIFIGANSTIIQNTKINDNNIIGAGAVITKDILTEGQTIINFDKQI